VRRAAELTVLAEKARHEALRAETPFDPDLLVRLDNSAARAVRDLGLDQRREPAKLSLRELLEQEAGGA